jgi:hypothetical protein
MQIRNTLFALVLGASIFACKGAGTPSLEAASQPVAAAADPQAMACDAAFDKAKSECIDKCGKEVDKAACEAACPAAAEKAKEECAKAGKDGK